MRTRTSGTVLATAMLAAVGCGGLEAQENTSPLPRHGCFRGRPLPECKSFWLYELRASLPIANTARELTHEGYNPVYGPPTTTIEEFRFAGALEFGYAWNLDERNALGATLAFEKGKRTRYRVRARMRRWIGDGRVSLEALPGFFGDAGNHKYYSFPGGNGALGFTLGLRVNILGEGFVGVRFDAVSVPERATIFDGGIRSDLPSLPERETLSPGHDTLFDPGGPQRGIHVVAGLSGMPALKGTAVAGILSLIVIPILVSTGPPTE